MSFLEKEEKRKKEVFGFKRVSKFWGLFTHYIETSRRMPLLKMAWKLRGVDSFKKKKKKDDIKMIHYVSGLGQGMLMWKVI